MKSTDLATTSTAAGAVPQIRADQTDWTPEQSAALDAIGIGDAPPAQQRLFLAECQRTGLDPFIRQIYMIRRRTKIGGEWVDKWTMQTGIDGFRLLAQRSGRWEGTSAPEWCGPDGQWRDIWTDPDTPPHAARVLVYVAGLRLPVVGVAVFAEFTAGQAQWVSKPAHMIAKCAEAQALRKAFPQDMAGLHIPEELDQPPRPPVSTAHLTPRPMTVERVDTETGEITATEVIDAEPVPSQADTLAHIGALFDQLGVTSRDERLLWVNQELALAGMLGGVPVDSADQMSAGQAAEILARLTVHTRQRPDQ